MKSTHYPSLELCRKLTEIGFWDTEKQYVKHEAWYYIEWQHTIIPSSPITDLSEGVNAFVTLPQ